MSNTNKMATIAKILDIDFEEDFKIYNMHGTYKITENGCFDAHNNQCPHILTALLTGKRTAYIPAWIPTSGEKYYNIAFGKRIWAAEWTNSPLDYYRLATGNVFKTKEKAQQNVKNITKMYDAIKAGAKLELITTTKGEKNENN